MPRKHVNIKDTKTHNKKQSSLSNSSGEANSTKANNKSQADPLARAFDTKRNNTRRKTSILRRLLSLSIITYFSYYVIYGCGSPFVASNLNDKPAVCESINALKMDIYALFNSGYTKNHVSPYLIDPIKTGYQHYGLPIYKKSQDLYQSYSVPFQEKSKQVYDRSIAPKVDQLLSSPFIQQKQNYIQNLYHDKMSPFMKQTKANYQATQETIYKKYSELPPPILNTFHQLKIVYDKAENTELTPILLNYYWAMVEFYQGQFKLWTLRNRYVLHLKTWIGQQEPIYRQHLSSYFQRHVKPYAGLLNEKLHQWSQYFSHQQPSKKGYDPLKWMGVKPKEKATIVDSVKEKLAQVNPKSDKPMLSKAVDSIKDQVQKVVDNNHASSTAAAISPLEKMEQVEDQAILL